MENQVPTWNYVAVHICGTLQKLDSKELLGTLRRLSANLEERLLPKPVWTIDKLSEQVLAKLSRQIVAIRMKISAIEGTWKLSQNKSSSARAGAISGLKSAKSGLGVNEIVALMELVSQE